MRLRLVRKTLPFVCILVLLIIFEIALRQRTGDNEDDAAPSWKLPLIEEQLKDFRDELNLGLRRADRNELVKTIESKPRTSRTPDVIIIGIRKCGTGSLRYFLDQHPSLVCDNEAHYYDLHPNSGLDFYKSLLPNGTTNQLIVDKTPAYITSLPVNLPEVIKRNCPGVKIIVMLCEPTHRSLSDHTQRLYVKRKNLKIGINLQEYVSRYLSDMEKMLRTGQGVEDILQQIRQDAHYTILLSGVYSILLPRWKKAFSDDHFLVVDGEQFIEEPGQVIEEIEKFLSIPLIIRKGDFATNKTTGLKCLVKWWEEGYTPTQKEKEEFHYCAESHTKGRTRSRGSKHIMSPKLAEKLGRFYHPFNTKLKMMINKNWKWLNYYSLRSHGDV